MTCLEYTRQQLLSYNWSPEDIEARFMAIKSIRPDLYHRIAATEITQDTKELYDSQIKFFQSLPPTTREVVASIRSAILDSISVEQNKLN